MFVKNKKINSRDFSHPVAALSAAYSLTSKDPIDIILTDRHVTSFPLNEH